jgi:hypothetical protein
VNFVNDFSRYHAKNMDRKDLLGIQFNDPEAPLAVDRRVHKHELSKFITGNKCPNRSRKVTRVCKNGDEYTTPYGYQSRNCPSGSYEYKNECEGKVSGDGILTKMDLTRYSRRPRWRQDIHIDGNKPLRKSLRNYKNKNNS